MTSNRSAGSGRLVTSATSKAMLGYRTERSLATRTISGERSRATTRSARCARSREGPGPAADLQGLLAPGRKPPQEEGMVMAVVVPAVIRDQGDPVEILPDLGHRPDRLGHNAPLSATVPERA